MDMKRIVTIQDISCVGKCSLTVALPVISAMRVEAAVLPTAVLSTHTMFKGFTFRDLTADIEPIAAHWKKEKFTFDAIYTGYLGSFEQLRLVAEFIADFKTAETLVFIDPVMADNGQLYPGFTPDFAAAMARLCAQADVIVPNLTEAAFLVNEPCRLADYDETYIQTLLRKLAALGVPQVVLTGVSFEPGKLGVIGYDARQDQFFSYFHQRIPVSFHGTGDIFSSAVVGALMRGYDLGGALRIAADFTVDCIAQTMQDPDHEIYGVQFEKALPGLIRRLGD